MEGCIEVFYFFSGNAFFFVVYEWQSFCQLNLLLEKMKKLISLSILVFIASGPITAQRVSPYQSGSYYPGLINLRDLAAAPAGLILLDYNYWYGSNGYYDKDCHEFTGGTIDLPPPYDPVDVTIEPNISGYTNVPVIFYASKMKKNILVNFSVAAKNHEC